MELCFKKLECSAVSVISLVEHPPRVIFASSVIFSDEVVPDIVLLTVALVRITFVRWILSSYLLLAGFLSLFHKLLVFSGLALSSSSLWISVSARCRPLNSSSLRGSSSCEYYMQIFNISNVSLFLRVLHFKATLCNDTTPDHMGAYRAADDREHQPSINPNPNYSFRTVLHLACNTTLSHRRCTLLSLTHTLYKTQITKSRCDMYRIFQTINHTEY